MIDENIDNIVRLKIIKKKKSFSNNLNKCSYLQKIVYVFFLPFYNVCDSFNLNILKIFSN